MQKIPFPPEARFLVRHVVWQGRECGLSLLQWRGAEITVTPFERETAGTVFLSGRVTIMRRGATAPDDLWTPGYEAELWVTG